jgi:hypothetical protein
MSLARAERRVLRRIDRALSRSAPQLHSEFWVFGNSGENRPAGE